VLDEPTVADDAAPPVRCANVRTTDVADDDVAVDRVRPMLGSAGVKNALVARRRVPPLPVELARHRIKQQRRRRRRRRRTHAITRTYHYAHCHVSIDATSPTSLTSMRSPSSHAAHE
jgi:hypothetical protein